MTISEKIKELRIERDLTQEELAEQLGISRQTYISMEYGKRELTLAEAKKLADFFSIQLEELLELSEYKVILENKPQIKPIEKLQIRVTRKNLDKFKQCLLYVLGQVGGKPNVGETVLHKLLYFIDFDYYEKFEENLMGATYIKNLHGPTSVELGTIIDDMKKNGEIEAVNSRYFKYDKKKYLPLKRPNLINLSAREIEHIDEVLARLSDKNAKEIENYSHEDIPWKTAKDGQSLSYESVFYRDERYSVRNYDDEL